MAEQSFDLVVIGSGPGGYVCAIRAAQLGLKTAVVEKDPHLGGTCLNVGCIPSKALLHSTEMVHFAKHQATDHGIKLGNVQVDIPTLMKKKDKVVDSLRQGVSGLLKARKVSVFKGTGSLAGDGKVLVSGEKEETLSAKNIVIATGSKSVELPFLEFDGKTVVNSDQAIAFDKIPKSLAVIGGGAIGLELGSVWSRLGSDVTIVEFLPEIAATYDPDVAKAANRIFKKQGLKIETNTKVTSAQTKRGKVILKAEQKGKELTFEAEKVLVSVGRKPFTDGLGLDKVGLKTDDKGRIEVDQFFATTVKGIYAIGDVTPGPMLAHKAEEEGVALAEMLAGKAGHVNYDVIPNVIYTEPEIASVGIGEKEAKDKGIEINVGKFPFTANGRAIATDGTDGFVKVIADAKTDRILGVQLIAKNGSELISEAVTHMEYGGSAEDLGRTIHAHPTLSEAVKEAGLAVSRSAIHSL